MLRFLIRAFLVYALCVFVTLGLPGFLFAEESVRRHDGCAAVFGVIVVLFVAPFALVGWLAQVVATGALAWSRHASGATSVWPDALIGGVVGVVGALACLAVAFALSSGGTPGPFDDSPAAVAALLAYAAALGAFGGWRLGVAAKRAHAPTPDASGAGRAPGAASTPRAP